MDQAALAALDDRVSTVASAIRLRLERLGDEDPATQDVSIEIFRGLEKACWMLRAHRA